MRKRTEHGLVGVIVIVLVAVVALAGFGIYWYFIRDTAPPAATTIERPTVAPASGPDGTWRVVAGDNTFAGFRIAEQFGPLDHTAVVRTPKASGTMTLSGRRITAAKVTADLTALESKDDQPPGVPSVGNRIGALETSGLETSRFPTATFTLSRPVTLPSAPKVGRAITVSAPGTLLLHGVTKNVTVTIEAVWNGRFVDASGTLPVVLADYGMTAPSRAFVSAADRGTLEFELQFAK